MSARPRGENVPFPITDASQIKDTVRIVVSLNGTEANPYNGLGLTCNPFPQLAKKELAWADRALARLAADPIPHDSAAEYIAQVLKGCDIDFIDLCVRNFVPGQITRFEIYIPGGSL